MCVRVCVSCVIFLGVNGCVIFFSKKPAKSYQTCWIQFLKILPSSCFSDKKQASPQPILPPSAPFLPLPHFPPREPGGAHFGIDFLSFWDHFGIFVGMLSGTFWDHFGIIVESFWYHFGFILESFCIILGGHHRHLHWVHLGTFWVHWRFTFGYILGTLGVHLLGTFYAASSSSSSSSLGLFWLHFASF